MDFGNSNARESIRWIRQDDGPSEMVFVVCHTNLSTITVNDQVSALSLAPMVSQP